MKVVICGSMTASKEMVEAEKALVEFGHVVVLPEFTHEYATMETFDRMHSESARNKVEYDLITNYYHKIKESDAILVINVSRKNISNYIGGNSFLEMGFAHILNKKIFLLNPTPEMGYLDEIMAMKPIIINGDYSKI
ncbi:MAG: hypothetical protein M3Q24_00040 [bacterium]|nr:hypothetical protein [bacterium]